MESAMSVIDRASGVSSSTSGNTYALEYAVEFTPSQSSRAKRWFGCVRAIRNQSKMIHEAHGAESVREKLGIYIAENPFLQELPESTIDHELQSPASVDWSSRKRDIQQIVIGCADFELTPRATVTVTGLGEMDVDFNEGIPEQFPVKIELTQDPAGSATIRLHYAGDFPNV